MGKTPAWLTQWIGVGVVVAAGVAVTVVALRGGHPARNPPTVDLPATSRTTTTSPETLAADAGYRAAMRSALAGVAAAGGATDFAAVQERLMGVTVPGRYRTWHLEMVIAAAAARQAQQDGNAERLAAAAASFAQLLAQSPWLAADAE